MKLIALNREPGRAGDAFPDSILIPDSAITQPGKPLFVPDFASIWEAQLLIGVRVNRLGKSISPRFASRYYDAVTLLMRLLPVPASQFPGALACAFDGSIQLGTWIESNTLLQTPTLTISCGELRSSLTPEDIALDQAVSAVSQYVSLRTGDILCPVALPWRITVKPGDTIEASLGSEAGNPCLHARLK